MTPVLVCRTAWMNEYRGITAADKPRGGGAFVKAHGFGSEIFNFSPVDGRYFGYVRPPGARGDAKPKIRIERLGASAKDERIDGATTFWVATHPSSRRTLVVGWYHGATVFRRWQPSTSPRRRLPTKTIAGFVASSPRATLLPVDHRTFAIPRPGGRRHGMGQSNVWYPNAAFARRLLRYADDLEAGHVPSKRKTKPVRPRLRDTAKRLAVELAAMEAVGAWCDRWDYQWEDVSKRKVGWDIEARNGPLVLRIEVKGSSAPIGDGLLELTPNEYQKMTSAEYLTSYRLAVVSTAQRKPRMLIFAWNPEREQWNAMEEKGRFVANLVEVRSARVTITGQSTAS